MAGIGDMMLGAGSGWARGGAALGQAMSGGAQQTYDDTMLRGHRVQRALMDAKKATEEYNAMARLEDTLRDALPQDQHVVAPFIATAMNAGHNPTQGFQAARESTRNSALSAAMAAGQADNIDRMNAMTAVAAQRPLDQTNITGNVMYNPNLRPEQQQAVLSPYGEGQLSNQGERTRGLNAASMASATRPRSGGRGQTSDNELDAMLDAEAKDAFRAARADGHDLYGITEADIRWQLANRGEARDADGNVIATFTGPRADFNSVSGAMDSTAPIASPSSAMSGAAVTEPRGQPRTPVSGVQDGGGELPPQALSQLSEGEVVTFANGQSWTLRGGRPVRVN